MMRRKACVLVLALGLAGACGDKAAPAGGAGSVGGTAGADATAGVSGGQNTAGTSASGAGTGAVGTAGTNGSVDPLPDGGTPPLDLPDAGNTLDEPCDYENEDVTVATDLVIPAGKTVHVCPGVKFTASKDVKVQVLGTLLVDGSTEAPVSFLGSAAAVRSWHGIVIESGGKLVLKHTKIGGAIYGMYAMAGSDFNVDTTEISTSFKAAIVQSDGVFTNSTFLAAAPPNIAITDAVSVDDPNGAVTIIDASPQVFNCKFEGASAFTDLVRVGGNSAAVFDHVHLHAAHCGFHTSGGTNTSIHVTNSIIEGMAYGIMAYATKPIIEDSVFKSNGNDVGICTGATEANTPVLMNNNYAKGSPTIDAGCFKIGTKDPAPAATANPSAGPSGL